jgi:type VI secretion system protein ImpL
MFSFFRRRIVIVAIGLALLALFIWFVGPYLSFGFGDALVQPLASETARLLTIAIVVALWAVSVLVKRLRAARSSDKLMAAVVRSAAVEGSRPSPDALLLRERFEEAVATLKQQRRGDHSLYDLPWYVIIGPEGAGKTTALVNSGLRFPLEQRTGKAALRGVGGTRNCDWWFTDEAVFLDTAGRYTTHSSDAEADSAGWSEFLGLLKKYRGRRPLNGVLVAISARDLLVQGATSREGHVAAVRRRLEELNRELKVQLPIYLLVTKCDLIAGFSEYFDDLTPEDRAQVWGTTFPYDRTLDGGGVKMLPAEIDALVERLNVRMFERLQAERDVPRRTKILAFPLQIAALREPLTEFVSDVFASTRFDRQVLLRGVYFTSGTQEGSPIDRLLGALVRRFAVAPDAVPPTGRGKAYFIQQLLRDVVFAESGLAGVNRRVEMRMAAWQLGAYGAALAAVVIGVVLLSISYRRNQAYLADVATHIERVREVPSQGPQVSLESVVPRLDAVRAVWEGAIAHRSRGTWSMRSGLYQGSTTGDAARDAYVRELDGALLERVTARIEDRLRGEAQQPEQLYEYLKAYLMLGQPERLDKEQLGFIADEEWSRATDADTAAALSTHFGSLLMHEATLRPMTLDPTLVAQARSTLRRASIERLVYGQLRLRYVDDAQSSLRLDVESGVGADRVLRRKSGRPLSQPVLGLYTAAVFRSLTGRNTEQVAREFTNDQWVWGEEGQPTVRSSDLVSKVTEIYEDDYIAQWDGILADIDVVAMGSLARTKDVLEVLARPTSPLRNFLRVVDEQTFLVKPPDPAEAATIKGRLGTVFGRGKQVLGISTVPPGTKVTKHFAELHRLVTGQGGNAPIDDVIRRLEELQKKMNEIGEGVGKRSPKDAGAVGEVGAIADSLKQDATQLPSAIATLVRKVADGAGAAVRSGLRGNLASRYEEDVLRECRTVTTNRYPFDRNSAVEVPVADFGRLFGPGGVYDNFFKNELADLVDTSRRPWDWRRDESGVPVGGALPLNRFEDAQQIREVFFRSGTELPEVNFRLTPIELDSGVRRFVLDVDGQTVEDQHATERTTVMTWPGKRPGPASATFEELSGNRSTTLREGAWAWFRLLETATVAPESDLTYVLTFDARGRRALVRLDALSIRNPFVRSLLSEFRCS